MCTLVAGDVHLKSIEICQFIDRVINKYDNIDRIVFCGDYTDDWDKPTEYQRMRLTYLKDWIDNKKNQGYYIDCLFGNHDFAYYIGHKGCGTNWEDRKWVKQWIDSMDLQITTVINNTYIVSHAGITNSWFKTNFNNIYSEYIDTVFTQDYTYPNFNKICLALNNALKTNTQNQNYDVLYSAGSGRGGYSLPGILWADAKELRADALCGAKQLVGHSPQLECWGIKLNEYDNAKLHSEVYFCDTWSTHKSGKHIGDKSIILVTDANEVLSINQNMNIYPLLQK